MEIIIILSKFVWGLIALLFVFVIMGLLIEVQNNLTLKNLEKRRAIMLDIIEEEIITLSKTQAGKFGASEVVVEVNRRINVKHFTNTDLCFAECDNFFGRGLTIFIWTGGISDGDEMTKIKKLDLDLTKTGKIIYFYYFLFTND